MTAIRVRVENAALNGPRLMPKKTLYHPGSLAEDLDVFLAELCEDWDFCAGVTGEQLVKTNPLVTPKRFADTVILACLLYTSPSPRDRQKSRMPSSA